MNAFESTPQQTTTAHPPAWGAVFSMALCVVVLIASEFMPVSLLTPIAQDLGISQGQAGQAISISGFFAVLTSLVNTSLTGHLDRKHVLLGFSLLLLVSGVIVTLASSGWVFMTGRALLGVAIGGFWSMSTATVMKLVPKESVAKGLALINGGNALAATVAAPLGSFMGQYIGWRGAFFLVVPLAALAFAWQWLSLPAMNNAPNSRARNPFQLLRTPQIAIGMTAIMLLFMGQFAVFTYLRPFLEDVTGVSVTTLSLMLLLLGASGLLGTYLIGGLLQKRIYACLIAIPLVMAVLALALTGLGHSPLAAGRRRRACRLGADRHASTCCLGPVVEQSTARRCRGRRRANGRNHSDGNHGGCGHRRCAVRQPRLVEPVRIWWRGAGGFGCVGRGGAAQRRY
ncbi:Major facilitator family transporter [Pseudomonas syringae pv. coriandricola]|uniref:Major facilitator family transporter n=1 Tax=Pseudomonas syringae pv. coriandricola TaxID=264453 RepID=A0A3M5RLT7_9PSED|nr:Major facilitator family transporter [Pseudomonas syringae pv. coriandricola]